eukprot:555155-Hanusia_phi.AAC.4
MKLALTLLSFVLLSSTPLRVEPFTGAGVSLNFHRNRVHEWSSSVNKFPRSLVASGTSRIRAGVVSLTCSLVPNLECVQNIRDLSSVTNSPVKPGRTACVGTASESDACLIVENIKTLIDLRSEKEYGMDSLKYNSSVWQQYDDLIYEVKKSKTGKPKALVPSSPAKEPMRARHMLSVIDEAIYKRGVFKRMSLRKKIKAGIYRAVSYTKARSFFIEYINNAGLTGDRRILLKPLHSCRTGRIILLRELHTGDFGYGVRSCQVLLHCWQRSDRVDCDACMCRLQFVKGALCERFRIGALSLRGG